MVEAGSSRFVSALNTLQDEACGAQQEGGVEGCHVVERCGIQIYTPSLKPSTPCLKPSTPSLKSRNFHTTKPPTPHLLDPGPKSPTRNPEHKVSNPNNPRQVIDGLRKVFGKEWLCGDLQYAYVLWQGVLARRALDAPHDETLLQVHQFNSIQFNSIHVTCCQVGSLRWEVLFLVGHSTK
jgi:hypothetical protein